MKSDIKKKLLGKMLKNKNIIATRYYTEDLHNVVLKDEIILNPNNTTIQNNITYFSITDSEIEIYNNIKENYIEFTKYQNDNIIHQILYYEIQS